MQKKERMITYFDRIQTMNRAYLLKIYSILCEIKSIILIYQKSHYLNLFRNSLVFEINSDFQESIIAFHSFILKHFLNTTLQKLCKFEAMSRPENQCKCHKDRP